MTSEDNPFADLDSWRELGVHWHAYMTTRPRGKSPQPGQGVGDRDKRLAQTPLAVLRSPREVEQWIDKQTREYVEPVEVRAGSEWVRVGDEADLAHLRRANYRIACRGDSIYTDIYSSSTHHDLYVESVTDDQCTNTACKNV